MNNWIFGYGPMPALNLEKYILPIFSLSAVIICFFLQMFIQVRTTSGQQPVQNNYEGKIYLRNSWWRNFWRKKSTMKFMVTLSLMMHLNDSFNMSHILWLNLFNMYPLVCNRVSYFWIFTFLFPVNFRVSLSTSGQLPLWNPYPDPFETDLSFWNIQFCFQSGFGAPYLQQRTKTCIFVNSSYSWSEINSGTFGVIKVKN